MESTINGPPVGGKVMDQDDTVKRAFPPAISLPIYIGF